MRIALSRAIAFLLVSLPASADPTRSMRLMTYNVNYANPDRRATIDAIADADADIVILQEVSGGWQHALDGLAKQYPHRIYRPHRRAPGGLAVLSKLPIRAERLIASPVTTWFPALVVAAPFGAVQILNVHLRPAVDGDSWLKGYFTTPSLRRREIEAYWPQLAHDVPTIVAGDFNEATADGLAVAFLETDGLAAVPTDGPKTWHYEALKIDLDHVLIDNSLVASDGHVLDVGTSDHRPVIVTIEPR